MSEKYTTPEDSRRKAQVFFDRGKTVAAAGNFDFAIAMYLEGLNLDPEAVEAHQSLRDIALKRKVTGGKGLGMFEMLKGKTLKDDKARMLFFEKALSFDPGNTDHMANLIVAAHKGGYTETASWIGPILFQANRSEKKPDFNKYLILKDVFKDLRQWENAIAVAQAALAVRPSDMDLGDEMKRMSAEQAMVKGRYGGNFQQSIANAGAQVDLMEENKDVQTQSFLDRQIAAAEAEYAANPNDKARISKLVEALRKDEDMTHENRAIEVLEDAGKRLNHYPFTQQVGDIIMKQQNRMLRARRDELKNATDPAQLEELKKEVQEMERGNWEYELTQFQERATNYPTDMNHSYEAGVRLFNLHRYEEAIPLFQKASNDPKLKVRATLLLGKSFFGAGFFDESAEVLGGIIGEHLGKGDKESLEMYYWRGRSLEQKGEKAEAIKDYSQVARWDFGYKDTQVRIKKLRAT